MDNCLADLPIASAEGIGPHRAGIFARIGIKTIRDALYYLPYRYENRTGMKCIRDAREGLHETVKGRVVSAEVKYLKGKRLNVFELTLDDATGLIRGKWFNQPFMKKNFWMGQEVILSGQVKGSSYLGDGFEIDNPEFEHVTVDKDAFIHTNRIVPVYRLTSGIGQKQFRKIMFGIVNSCAGKMRDPLPPEIILRNNLPLLGHSLMQVHFPDESSDLLLFNMGMSIYHQRLSFDELFLFELGMAMTKRSSELEKGIAFVCQGILQKRLRGMLPFELTGAQKRVLGEILRDMNRPYPMHRLLQGDVGSGKTVVALLSMLNAVECGYQAALMAPTEILAEQHYNALRPMIESLGLKLSLLAGSSGSGQCDEIAEGKIDIIFGTHAVIQEGVIFRNLGLAVIDEQHKFGVMQRLLLRKKGRNPDVLVMTATPIPRTLALTLYGDLDCSVIDEIPPDRKPVITKVFNAGQKDIIYGMLEDEIRNGRQAYVVYPAIEESETIGLKSAVKGREAFRKIFPSFRTSLVHGRMKAAERTAIMASFRNGDIDILISTTLIEVGVDVPNATLMLVIHAERFGLAQLHQLRGRVGRGSNRAYCLLVTSDPCGKDAERRLACMAGTNDGFRIAEEDLAIRGPGEFLGTRQSGMPDLKVADIIKDIQILEAAKREAFDLIESSPQMDDFPFLRNTLGVFWKGRVDLNKAG